MTEDRLPFLFITGIVISFLVGAIPSTLNGIAQANTTINATATGEVGVGVKSGAMAAAEIINISPTTTENITSSGNMTSP